MRLAQISEDYWICDNLQINKAVEKCNNEINCEDESDEFDCANKIKTPPTVPHPVRIQLLENDL